MSRLGYKVLKKYAELEVELKQLTKDLGELEQLAPYERSYVLRRLYEVFQEFEVLSADTLTHKPYAAISNIEPFA